MSHSISARNKETSLISVTVWDFDGNVFFEEKFDDYRKAIPFINRLLHKFRAQPRHKE